MLWLCAVPAGAFTLDEGARAYERKDYGRAEEIFRERADQAPGRERPLYNLGNSLYRQGRFEEATGAYGGALKADPKLADGWYNLGNALYRQDRFKDAVEAYTQTLKLEPDDADARHNLQLAARRLKEDPKSDKSRNDDQKKDPPTPPPSPPKGSAKEKQGDGKQDAGDRKKGDRMDASSKKEKSDPNAPQGDQANDQRRREGEARRQQARKDLGMDDSQVEQLLSQMQKQERDLQPYFQPNMKHPQQRDDIFDMLPPKEAEMMRRYFGRRFQQMPGPGQPEEDW